MKELKNYIEWMNRWKFTTIKFTYSFKSTYKAEYGLGEEIKELRYYVVPQLLVLEDHQSKWEIKPNTIIYTFSTDSTDYKVKVFKGKVTAFIDDERYKLTGTDKDPVEIINMIYHIENELPLIHSMRIIK
ncbi:hypothetical protein ACIQT3_02155 [Enterobacter sichuanensis]|uniref:hypothetical protein n=1 Tax=Enterobacter sichuanensis TaxID=2071710 RepID=UPI00383B893D